MQIVSGLLSFSDLIHRQCEYKQQTTGCCMTLSHRYFTRANNLLHLQWNIMCCRLVQWMIYMYLTPTLGHRRFSFWKLISPQYKKLLLSYHYYMYMYKGCFSYLFAWGHIWLHVVWRNWTKLYCFVSGVCPLQVTFLFSVTGYLGWKICDYLLVYIKNCIFEHMTVWPTGLPPTGGLPPNPSHIFFLRDMCVLHF